MSQFLKEKNYQKEEEVQEKILKNILYNLQILNHKIIQK